MSGDGCLLMSWHRCKVVIKLVREAGGKPLSQLTVPLILRGLRLRVPSMLSLMFQVVDYCRVVRPTGTK